MTDATFGRPMTKNLFILALLVGTVSPSFAAPPPAPEVYRWVRDYVLRKQTAAGKRPKGSIPRIASDYVNVYRPAGDVFPGPNAAHLVAGRFYADWVPNDHCFVRDESGRWHALGITHPLTDRTKVHAGEYQSFHTIARLVWQ